jgi:hypothetical protein
MPDADGSIEVGSPSRIQMVIGNFLYIMLGIAGPIDGD